MHQRNRLEKVLELTLFESRWLLAPFYLGLVVALFLLLVAFVGELVHAFPSSINLAEVDSEHTILLALGLIDLSLAGNLVVIVIFSGYENFVSKIDTENARDRPSWMGTLDFSGLKMKLIGSIVAISAISLLRAFMTLTELDKPFDVPHLRWMLYLHLTFVISGLLFAVMDYIANRAEKPKEAQD
ncbi:MAG TPA: TIGR00645 family protein [Rhizomicrobium sp.]|nr:TIGR00645 family protein [Rhizomicrobium sp.]